MQSSSGAAGLAALAICESMLLSLTDGRTIDAAEANAILRDAAEAHRQAALLGRNVRDHREAAMLIERLLQGGGSVQQD